MTSGDGGPDWERVARRAVAVRIESFFDAEVRTRAYRVADAIDGGDDPSEEFWLLVARYGEFLDRLAADLERVGALEADSPRVERFRSARRVQRSLERLGAHVEASEADGDGRRRAVDAARTSLAEAEAFVDGLERAGDGCAETRDSADGESPSSESRDGVGDDR